MRHLKSFALAFFLGIVVVSLPAQAEAAETCYCRFAYPSDCRGEFDRFPAVTSKESCELTCGPNLKTVVDGISLQTYDRALWQEEGSHCDHKVLADGRCALEEPSTSSCRDFQQCYCRFRDDKKGEGGQFQGVSCKGRFWHNVDGDGDIPSCQSSCGTYLGSASVIFGFDYNVMTQPVAERSLCFYDKEGGGGCSNDGEDIGIVNFGENWKEHQKSQCRSGASPNSQEQRACEKYMVTRTCSPLRCNCTYPDSYVTPTCRGRNVFTGYVASGTVCNEICKDRGLDVGALTPASGPPTCSFLDAPTFNASAEFDDCKKPAFDAPDCAASQAAHDAAAFALSQGSVLTLPLPLSDISVEAVIGRVLNTLLGTVGAIALLLFVWGGIRWMTAAGDSAKIDGAKKTITWAAIGLIAIFSSYAVLKLVIETFSK